MVATELQSAVWMCALGLLGARSADDKIKVIASALAIADGHEPDDLICRDDKPLDKAWRWYVDDANEFFRIEGKRLGSALAAEFGT